MKRILIPATLRRMEAERRDPAAEVFTDLYAEIRRTAAERHPRRRVRGRSAAGTYKKWRRERDARTRAREEPQRQRARRERSAKERLAGAGVFTPQVGWSI